MSALTVFSFQESHPIRVVLIGGEPWFVAADVCRALDIGNPTKAIKNLDDDEVALTSIQGLSRGNDQANIVSESGLYTLILRCRDAVKQGTTAWRFRKWVTNEVLPAIRKTGGYTYAEPAPKRSAEPLTWKDQDELKWLINDIARSFRFHNAWVNGIWYALRRAAGNPSPNPITVEDLPAMVRELRRILTASEGALGNMGKYERELLKKVVRGGQEPSAVEPLNDIEVANQVLPAHFELALEKLEKLETRTSCPAVRQ